MEGQPGSGKTTLALQFLLEGRRLGKPSLDVSLSETKEQPEDKQRSQLAGFDHHLVKPVDPSLLDRLLAA